MCFLAPKNFSAKSVKKWPRNDQKTFLGPKRVKNVVFGPPKIFSQIGQKMAKKWPTYLFQAQKGSKMWFLAPKKFSVKLVKKWPKYVFQAQKGSKMWFLAPKKFSAKSVKKWPKFGQKTISRPKKVQKCGFWPRKNFQPNRSENGRNLAKRQFLGPKRVKNVVFGPEKIFSQISQKMAEKWPKGFFQAQKG